MFSDCARRRSAPPGRGSGTRSLNFQKTIRERFPAVAAISCQVSADVGCAPLGFRFHGGLWLRRQLKNCGLLTLTQRRQEHDLAIGKFQGVVMSSNLFFVDLPKDCCFVIYHFVSRNLKSRSSQSLAHQRSSGIAPWKQEIVNIKDGSEVFIASA